MYLEELSVKEVFFLFPFHYKIIHMEELMTKIKGSSIMMAVKYI